MSSTTREQRLERRIADLYAHDPQFAAAAASPTVTTAAAQPGLRLPQIVATVLEGYADRPALGQRVVRFRQDPITGRTSRELLPAFQTITYGELWARASALAGALSWSDPSAVPPIQARDRVGILGFSSIDYTVIELALIRVSAVCVPLQTSASHTQLQPILSETQPQAIFVSVDNLQDAVDLIRTGHAPTRLVVFDYHPHVDDQHDIVEAAQAQLAAAGIPIVLETLTQLLEQGKTLPAPPLVAADDADDTQDELALLLYTSGSTGAPKGAIYPESHVANFWVRKNDDNFFTQNGEPAITLSFMPMSHLLGRGTLFGTLSRGGTTYFAATSDLSTFLDDLALVRPTEMNFVPRVWEMLFEEFHNRLDRAASEAQLLTELREQLLGGRCVRAMTGSAPISAEIRTWVESLLDMHLVEGYGSTEAGVVIIDGQVQRPHVTDYKLVDVPELGYFGTDQPHPRGELLVKTEGLFPGYYQRPEVNAEVFDADGYYRTGDVVAEVGPDQVVYLDRRNNVVKLAQGEFVTLANLEAVFSSSPLIRQIYLYGDSTRAYLLAVVVPTDKALARWPLPELKPLINQSLQDIAKSAGLQSYEIPRDFVIETESFTLENGLLTGIRKLARPKLKQRYGDRLNQLYAELARTRSAELHALRHSCRDLPVLETVSRAAAAMLGATASDLTATVGPDAHFTDLGGDSLSALTFANLLHELLDVEVPVNVIVSPANDLRAIADYITNRIESSHDGGPPRATFAEVHGAHANEIHASDLRLDKFLDAATLAGAARLADPSPQIRTVLLTGVTGFLGRYLMLEWLERLAPVDGRLICLVRAKSNPDAQHRLDQTFDSGDPELLQHYHELAAGHHEVLAADLSEANLGLDPQTWQRLADTVDLIVHPAALVNHVLPYSELFGPNVVGTAELIRIALTSRRKPFIYLSTVGVGDQIKPGEFTEDADIRIASPRRTVDASTASYANGYANSKWAGEVLLRAANDMCGLPVAVFRCDMILADTTYRGQLNLPDMFTRLMLSLVATGLAPGSFYERAADGSRQPAHYDGLPVEFVAEAVSTLGTQLSDEFCTYHVMNPHDDGIGLDEFVDWLIEAGYPIQRIADYQQWLQRFEAAIQALPDAQRRYSLLPLLHNYRKPATPVCGALAPTNRFRAAIQDAKISPDKDIPHISAPIIVKYATDLQLLGLL
ncbi:MAG: carboxylic acid reductase [Mycobacteriaceae bacterium]|nr:carboxylic acid reductase [Mycobacteriaceae bacterium]